LAQKSIPKSYQRKMSKWKERSTMTIEINDKSFEQEVLKSELPVVVDFWAPWCGPCRMVGPIVDKLSDWCGPCRMVGPIVDKLSEEYKGRLKFCKLNVDENRDVATKYQIMSIPMLLFFKGGEVVDQSLGAVPEQALRPKVEELV